MSSNQSETKQRILEATVTLLEAQGGRGVRMADVAKQAGISRQAVYLHFASRTELLEAITQHLDHQLNLESRLAPSRHAQSGEERLALYIEFWGNYIPEIYSVAKALLLVLDTDEAAANAWQERMLALKEGCRAAIQALNKDNKLASSWDEEPATDFLYSLMSVQHWEQLTIECGWSNEEYIKRMKSVAFGAFVKP